MRPTIIPREQVAQNFAVTTHVLTRFESRGLVRVVREGDVEGYTADEIRRIWTIISLHRDLGINLAGIEAILQLHAQFDELGRKLEHVARQLQEALDEEQRSETDA